MLSYHVQNPKPHGLQLRAPPTDDASKARATLTIGLFDQFSRGLISSWACQLIRL